MMRTKYNAGKGSGSTVHQPALPWHLPNHRVPSISRPIHLPIKNPTSHQKHGMTTIHPPYLTLSTPNNPVIYVVASPRCREHSIASLHVDSINQYIQVCKAHRRTAEDGCPFVGRAAICPLSAVFCVLCTLH